METPQSCAAKCMHVCACARACSPAEDRLPVSGASPLSLARICLCSCSCRTPIFSPCSQSLSFSCSPVSSFKYSPSYPVSLPPFFSCARSPSLPLSCERALFPPFCLWLFDYDASKRIKNDENPDIPCYLDPPIATYPPPPLPPSPPHPQFPHLDRQHMPSPPLPQLLSQRALACSLVAGS